MSRRAGTTRVRSEPHFSPTGGMRARQLQVSCTFGLIALLLLANSIFGQQQAVASAWNLPTASRMTKAASAVASYAATAAKGLADSVIQSSEMDEDATDVALEGFRSLFDATVEGDSTAKEGVASVAKADGASSAKAGGHACLITKWSAVWLVDINKTRSHVGFPAVGCELRAAVVGDLDAFPKAHGGEGGYFLDREASAEACTRSACSEGGSAAGAPSAAGATPAQSPPEVVWGAGVPPNGSWMASSPLRFSRAAVSSFRWLQLAAGEPLLLVFGGASVNDMLGNWVRHVQRLPSLAFVVACMDVQVPIGQAIGAVELAMWTL